jgi:23S rRNA (pseudouridine1915-N3)-methyltransferase
MKLEIWSIGKANDAMIDKGITEFIKRINRYYTCELKTFASKAPVTAPLDPYLNAEMLQIQDLLQSSDLLIVLDDKAKQLTTLQLSTQFEKWLSLGKKRIIFLIGGAYGIHKELKKTAHAQLSLSALTFPHQLVRLILCEQLYRVCTVLRGENYHHEA